MRLRPKVKIEALEDDKGLQDAVLSVQSLLHL
jgi:hypothetical protein